MGAGISRMNIYTVAQATQGLAELIRQENAADKGVAIAHDSRNNSRLFAEISARVLAANGITVYLFDSLRPTPELSFAILELGCISGINITASHNPKEYNGYKVYWSDGAQLPPEHAAVVCEKIAGCDMFSVPMADLSDKHIHVIGSEIDEKYIDAVLGCVIDRDALKKFGNSLNLVYTPLHGTGYRLVPEAMRRAGISNLTVIPEQAVPDGNFPTVSYPNPESPAAWELALALAKKEDADIVLATDPDADRLGVYCKDTKTGEYVSFTGNMSGMLIAEYILRERKATGTMPENPALVETIVTTDMAKVIAADYGVKLIEVLTGFKYIGEQIRLFEKNHTYNYVFGLEESYGCLAGTYARDKDACVAVMMLCEVASYYKSQGKTLWDAMVDMYEKYGYFKEGLETLTLKGIDGAEQIQNIMTDMRNNPPKELGGYKVVAVRDYKEDTRKDLATGEVTKTGLPTSNVLYYELTDNAWCCVRPSGTEPKVKFYYGVKGTSLADADEKSDAMGKAVLEMVDSMK